MQHSGMTLSYFILRREQRKHRLRKGPLGVAQGHSSLSGTHRQKSEGLETKTGKMI